MQTTFVTFVGQNQCPFKYDGVNLAAIRRAKLLKIARGVNALSGGNTVNTGPEVSKNDLLIQIIAIGKARSWEAELSELFDKAVEETKKPAKKKAKKKK